MLEEEMGDLEIYYVAGWGWPLCVLISANFCLLWENVGE